MKHYLGCALLFASLAASATVVPLPGSIPQSIPQGSLFAPIRVQVTDAAGNPAAGAYVRYNVGWYWSSVNVVDQTHCFPDLGDNCEALADAHGVAELNSLRGNHPGPTDITIHAGTTRSGADLGSATIRLEVLTAAGTVPSYQALWWGGPSENGWGMSIVQHGDALFNTIFAYDAQGEATWYVQPGGAWTRGTGSSFLGDWYTPRSAPYFAYDASLFAIGPKLDTGFIDFMGPENATLNVALGNARREAGAQAPKFLRPMDFSPEVARPNKGISDLWWGGPSQNGWGVSIMENGGNLFAVWFTYGADGKAVWFPLENGAWVDDTTYRGTIFRTSGTPWPYRYDAPRVQVTSAGTFELRITDASHLAFDYTLDGRKGTLALERLDF